MTPSAEMECAVWYTRYRSVLVEVFDDEEQAACFAASIEDAGDGSIEGVQRSDGSFTARDEWAAYAAEEERRTREAIGWAAEQAAKPPPPRRKVRVPWDENLVVEVDPELPSWLGRP